MKSLKNTRYQAFSFIELSVVILIIGILIAGLLASQTIISKFRITSAQTLTISSPVNGISDSTIWLESSLDKSFKDSESSDTNTLSAWYDIRESVNKNNAIQTNSSNAPTYSNTINYIHAVKFDGTNSYLTIPATQFLFLKKERVIKVPTTSLAIALLGMNLQQIVI